MAFFILSNVYLPYNKMRLRRCHRRLVLAVAMLMLLLLYCECLHYFIVLIQCTWPRLQTPSSAVVDLGSESEDLKVMFLADTHLLGSRKGHWFDKLRREWQMKAAFQTSMLLHHPEIVFVLGDLLDEGKWCTNEEFQYHAGRFDSMFAVPSGTQRHLVVGNHDVGFHYMITPGKQQRFEDAFGSKSVAMLNIRGVVFVLLNSMAMEGDGCWLCGEAQRQLQSISHRLQCAKEAADETQTRKESCQNGDFYDSFHYSKPILLQHFPLYRPSDANCSTVDAAPDSEKFEQFKPRFDTLDKSSTIQLFNLLEPRLVIDGHVHHGCYRLHDNGVPEWTLSSFSWRNKHNPAFIMARISSKDHKIHLCQMPNERTVIGIYVVAGFIILLFLCLPLRQRKLGKTS